MSEPTITDTLRKAIGWLGLTIPFVLVLGAWNLQPSISDYYYTNMRDYFEGVLFLLAAFLVAYRPYGADGWKDNWITNAAGFFALVLVLFPTSNALLGHVPHELVLNFLPAVWSGSIHNLGSGGLFVSFAVLSFFFFTRGPKDGRTVQKRIRNALYRVFGLGIGACIGFIGVLALTAGSTGTDGLNIVVPEALALVFFGCSWLIKGGAFPPLND
jgi:hypothetical protein